MVNRRSRLTKPEHSPTSVKQWSSWFMFCHSTTKVSSTLRLGPAVVADRDPDVGTDLVGSGGQLLDLIEIETHRLVPQQPRSGDRVLSR